MLQYNKQVLKFSGDTVQGQSESIRLAFDVIHKRDPWQDDTLFESQFPNFTSGVVGPDESALKMFSECVDWMGTAVKRLHTPKAHEVFEQVRNHVLFVAEHNRFEIPLDTCMHALIFHLGLFYSEPEIGVIGQHISCKPTCPKTGKPFIGIIIHCNADAPEMRANHEFIAELSNFVTTKMYVVNGDASGFDMANTEVCSCKGMYHADIAELIRKDNPILVLNASATSLDVTKLGVAPRVMQFIGIDVPTFNHNWITHRYMNSEQHKRLVSPEIAVMVNHYHHMAKVDILRPETQRKIEDTFRIGTHFRDIKASTQLKDTILNIADADERIEVVVSIRDATGSLMDIDHERVLAGWHMSMEDPNPFREHYDLIVDSPALWSMHHTMLVWMRAGVPIAVVKPAYDTVFSKHSTDMVTMLGMRDDLYFECDADLVERVKVWVEQPDVFADVRKRFEEAVSKIPSNQQAARNFHEQVVALGLLSNVGLVKGDHVEDNHEEELQKTPELLEQTQLPEPIEPTITKQVELPKQSEPLELPKQPEPHELPKQPEPLELPKQPEPLELPEQVGATMPAYIEYSEIKTHTSDSIKHKSKKNESKRVSEVQVCGKGRDLSVEILIAGCTFMFAVSSSLI